MSRLEWEKSMLALYTSKKKRMAFASGEIYHDFRGAIESVEDHLDKHKVRRNLKVRFIEELLDRESRDGYLIISLIDHLRREFGNTKPRRALKSLLEEWKEQERDPTTHDTLFFVLSKRMHEGEIPLYLRHALLCQCKRVRSHEGPTNRRAARRILRQAEKQRLDELRIPEGFVDYSMTPWKFKAGPPHAGLELQSLFCEARFSNWKKVVKDTYALLDKIEDTEGLADPDAYPHRPDILLKWWCYDVLHRAACWCSHQTNFLFAKEKLKALEEDSPSNLREYFEDQRKPADHQDEWDVFTDFFGAWKAFEENWEAALAYRVGGGRKPDIEGKSAKWYTEFTKALQGLNELFHYGSAKGRPKFVPHSYSTSGAEAKRRTENILAEISQASHMVVMSDTFRTAYLLEILHRLLIYRLWWESINYRPEDLESERPLFFEPEAAIRILENIRNGMREARVPLGPGWRDGFKASIKTLRGLQNTRPLFIKVNREREEWKPERGDKEENKKQVKGFTKAVTKDLRKRLDDMQASGKRRYRETNSHERYGICQIFGIPYRPKGEDPLEFMGPRLALGRAQISRKQPLD